ncbi:MAG: DUF4813 domain-containing protein [Parachlamydia sp.]|nr:DUF4813 domain-containing protein [Parachlamydia sp.]
MTAPLNGRNLLYREYTQNKDKCRQAVQAIQNKAVSDAQAMNNVKPDNTAIGNIRRNYAAQLSQALFGADENEKAAFMEYLRNKVQRKRSDLTLPECWSKLFNKIVDPTKVMKSSREKQLKDFQEVLGRWQETERQINQLFNQHNRELAQVNFSQLAAEIDNQASPVSNFKDALRNWANNSTNQPGGPRLQELCAIANFSKDFLAWQEELLEELRRTLQNPSKPALKSQYCLLSEKLAAFLQAVTIPQETQKLEMGLMMRASRMYNPAPQLPVGVLNLSPEDRRTLISEGRKYAGIAPVILDPRVAVQTAQQPPAQASAPAAQPQAKQAAAPAQRVAAANPSQRAPVAPQQVYAQAPAKAPSPLPAAQQPPVTPVQNNIPKPQAAAQTKQKPNGFVVFLKRCGNLFVQIVTFPFWLLKMLFTSNKKK